MVANTSRILANQHNAPRPIPLENQARSRCNALKHGLTGAGVALSNEDASEVERVFMALECDMKPSCELSRMLVRRIATQSVRLDRSVAQETAAICERVRQAEVDFVAPEGLAAGEGDRLRAEFVARAMFDPSKEATLARRYEAATERSFFSAIKEFRQIERELKVATPEEAARAHRESLGSFLPVDKVIKLIETLPVEKPRTTPPAPSKQAPQPVKLVPGGVFEVPFAIGKPR